MREGDKVPIRERREIPRGEDGISANRRVK